jgi:hypothetical protein
MYLIKTPEGELEDVVPYTPEEAAAFEKAHPGWTAENFDEKDFEDIDEITDDYGSADALPW